MKLPFMQKKDKDNDYGDQYTGDDYPATENRGAREGGNILLRVVLYSGVFIVLVSAVGGYYYLNYTRGLLNKRISGNPSGLVKAFDLGGGENVPASREAPFIEGQSKETREQPPPLLSNEPAREMSLVGASGKAQTTPEAPPAREASVSPETVPEPPGKTSPGMVPKPRTSQDQPETLLNSLVLRDENPFRAKFLRRFQESPASKISLKDTRRSVRSGQASRSSRSGGAGKPVSGLGGEFAILPDIAVGGDRPGELRVVGIIQTKDTSIALTNKGELRVGSTVDGDAVTGITINEVRLKSGRALKVTAQ